MFREPLIKTTVTSTRCKRCGNNGYILENGYCVRCDDVIYGKPKIVPQYPRRIGGQTYCDKCHRLTYPQNNCVCHLPEDPFLTQLKKVKTKCKH